MFYAVSALLIRSFFYFWVIRCSVSISVGATYTVAFSFTVLCQLFTFSVICYFNFLVEASLSDSGGRQKLLERAKEKRVGMGMEGQGMEHFLLAPLSEQARLKQILKVKITRLSSKFLVFGFLSFIHAVYVTTTPLCG